MSTEWAVVAADDQFTLDARNSGIMTFTVSNPGTAPDTVVFDILPGDGSQRSWFFIEEPQREVRPQEAVAFNVKLTVPAGTPARRYDMTGLAYSASTAPEESSRTSGRVSYDVATTEKPKKKIPWLFIIAAIALVVVVGGVVTFLLTRGGDDVTPPANPVAGKAYDMTGDGKADLALTGVSGWTTLPLAVSKGDGTFTVHNKELADFPALAATPGAQAAHGDFDGDGKVDIALAGAPGWGGVPMAFSKGDGTFRVTNKTASDIPGWAATPGARVLAGDFDGDGRDDLLMVGGLGWPTMPVAFSKGDGTFRSTNEAVANVNGWAYNPAVKAVIGDVNGDGKDDLVIAGGSGWTSVPVAFSNGDGTFRVTNLPAGDIAVWAATPGTKVAAGDLDGDGKDDLVITGGAGWNTLPVGFSTGDGTFRVTNNQLVGIPGWATAPSSRVVAADFDGDGKDDVALVGGTGWSSVPLAISSGNGTFAIRNEPIDQFAVWAQGTGVKVV